MIDTSRGDRTLLINQLDTKGLMTDSISENGLFFRNPFLTCTRWCEVPFLHDFPHSIWENIKKYHNRYINQDCW